MSEMSKMKTLYIDMDSFFASVEQQMNPSYRGRPVAIITVESESGTCIAASYEAKACGVKTGTKIREARRLCPGIVFCMSRHILYSRVSAKVSDVVDQIAELELVRSIDEFQVGLGGDTAALDGALALGRKIKNAIRNRVGSELRCSIGIGPNHLLAKIAGKIDKPDGLAWLAPENMPARIEHLALDDLPGISHAILSRLNRAGITDIAALYAMDPRHARQVWGSVEGERFVRGLQGMDIPLLPTKRGGYGNSKVLAPEYRSPANARLVGRWLVEKACERMRCEGYCARRFNLYIRLPEKRGWHETLKIRETQDTRFLLSVFETLWERMMRIHPRKIMSVGVQLSAVIRLEDRNGDLFAPLAPGEKSRSENLSAAVDHLNGRFGKRVISVGVHQEHPGFFEKE